MNRRAFLVSSFLLGVMHATGIKPKLLPITAWGVADVKCEPFKLRDSDPSVYWVGSTTVPDDQPLTVNGITYPPISSHS